MSFKEYFGLSIEPLTSELRVKDLITLEGKQQAKTRLDYCLSIHGYSVVTGEVGAGKSTLLRWSLHHYHLSESKVISIVASNASALELYRSIALAQRQVVLRACKKTLEMP